MCYVILFYHIQFKEICFKQRQRNVSSSVDEESTSAAEGTLDEEVKKVATDPFRSLLEKLRRKQCGMWEKGFIYVEIWFSKMTKIKEKARKGTYGEILGNFIVVWKRK